MELYVSADLWSNNYTGELIFLGNNYSYQLTLVMYTVREDFWESEEYLETNPSVTCVLPAPPHPVLILPVDVFESFVAFG